MKFAGWTILLFCLLAISPVSIYSQDPAIETDPARAFYKMTRAAPAEYTKGNLDRAQAIAHDLLKEAPNWEKDWNYGNAIHAANIVLGRVALRRGEIDEAKEYLLEAGRTPGSPQLNTFGPDMTLAREMLKQGEKDAVLQYFGLCEKFWKMHKGRLDEWRAAVNSGQMPEFGANLRYLGSW